MAVAFDALRIAAELPVLDELLGRPAWHRGAACRERPEVNFVPGRGESAEPALAVCEGCAVVSDCLAYALELGEDAFGVWGATTGRQRRRLRRAARREVVEDEPGSLRARRRAAGLLQRDVADSLGVTQECVSAWERGSTRPSASHEAALAALFATAAQGRSPSDATASWASSVENAT